MANSTDSMSNVQQPSRTRSIFRILFMPEIKLSFGTTGMTHRAFLSVLAMMFIQAGLLPYNHPARSLDTIGNISFRSIMGEAWFNLRTSNKGDLQQYGLFFAVFLLLALAIMMVVTFIAQLAVSTAIAAPSGLFTSPAPATDIGLQLIEQLIGAASRGEGAPHGTQLGVLLSTYSYGVLVIASFIVAWSVLSVVVDTAATGRFFGGRHSSVWWPIRLVFALGILIPLGHGFSAGQYMVIQVAKWGSNLASNAWFVYVEAVVKDGSRSFISNQYPTAKIFIDFRDIAKIQLCKEGINKELENKNTPADSRKWIVPHSLTGNEAARHIFQFGERGRTSGRGIAGGDKDKCGKITLTRPSKDLPEGLLQSEKDVDWTFIALVNNIINSSNTDDTFFNIYSKLYSDAITVTETMAKTIIEAYDANGSNFSTNDVTNLELKPLYDRYQLYFTEVEAEMEKLSSSSNEEIKEVIGEVKKYGWPTAALWYYIISSTNQKVDETMMASAKIEVGYYDGKDANRNFLQKTGNRFLNLFKKDETIHEDLQKQKFYAVFETWWKDEINELSAAIEASNPSSVSPSDQRLLSQLNQQDTSNSGEEEIEADEFVSKIFDKMDVWTSIDLFIGDAKHAGLQGDDNVHPIVLMAGIGDSMLAFAGGIITVALVAAAVVGIKSLTTLAAIASTAAGIVFIFVSPLVITGVILSVILPMTPFIRFVFAISGWMIALVEAVVMIPVVAIGHLRTDGEGLMGPMMQGFYLMMLQLLLRPVLIVIGLVLSMFLVEVTVNYVNYIFFAMLDSLPSGAGINIMLGLIRFVGFGVMYGVLMYGLINSSFKLVDILPEAVVKYLGGGASGGVTDRDEGDINRAVLASAVFASGAQAPRAKKPEPTSGAGVASGGGGSTPSGTP